MNNAGQLSDRWIGHTADWRDPAQICSQWREAADVDPRLFQSRTTGSWWQTIEELGVTLFVTREYEHLAMAFSAAKGQPKTTYFPVPHPSGLAVDRKERKLYLASTRNPNQVFSFRPVSGLLERTDGVAPERLDVESGPPMMPVASSFYPGSLYLHDLALVGRKLYANAVGHNAVVSLSGSNRFDRVWWPKCVEVNGSPVFTRNHIQLNSIAAGKTLAQSFFSASSDKIGRFRPGHQKYPVKGRGVIFAGGSREVVCSGLTRPHSTRFRNREVWVANSGYGEVGLVQDGRLQVVCKLPGWTRGLCLIGDVALVGTSRIIPEFACYAPGLDPRSSFCGIHAVSCKTGNLLGSIEWPAGNQIFAIDWIPSGATSGFPFEAPRRRQRRDLALFYRYLNQ